MKSESIESFSVHESLINVVRQDLVRRVAPMGKSIRTKKQIQTTLIPTLIRGLPLGGRDPVHAHVPEKGNASGRAVPPVIQRVLVDVVSLFDHTFCSYSFSLST
jgi:hypothetical protein